MDKKSSKSQGRRSKDAKNVEASKTDIGSTKSEAVVVEEPDDDDKETADEVFQYDDESHEGDEDQKSLDVEGQSALILHMLMNKQNDNYSFIKLAKLMQPSASGVNLLETPSMKAFADEEERQVTYEAIYGKAKSKRSADATDAGESGGPPAPRNLYEALQSELIRSNTVMSNFTYNPPSRQSITLDLF